jgi:hypothetical protein
MIRIGGHEFPDHGPCHCGIHWTTIRNTTLGQVGQPGIAHVGNLTRYEYDQIAAERAAEDARIAAAMDEATR